MAGEPSDADAVRDLLAENAQWHLWVIEYGFTHSFMRLALHIGSYPRHAELHCSDCIRFEGDLQGGPYSLEVGNCDWHGDSVIELRDVDGRFRLVCGRLSIGRRRV